MVFSWVYLKYDGFTRFALGGDCPSRSPGGREGRSPPAGDLGGEGVLVQARVFTGEGESAFVLEFPEEGGEFAGDGDDAFAVHEAAGS